MGIRFECPHCHGRLNVKAFLAGKQGVCPQCGGPVLIPLASEELPRSGSSNSSDRIRRAAVAVAEPKVSPRPPAGTKPAPPGDREPSSGNREPAKNRRPGANGTAADLQAAANCPSPPRAPGAKPASSERASPERSSGSSAAHGGAGGEPEPWDEDPEAIWYVRPPSGGQFGPAAGEIMSRWVAEGRVAPEAFIWREGWNDWRLAADVLSRRSPITPPAPPRGPTEPPVALPPADAVPGVAAGGSAPGAARAAATAEQRYYRRRRSRRGLWITVVVLLATTAVVLLAALAYVLQSR